MLEFIQLLKQRYQAVLDQQRCGDNEPVYRQRIDQLLLAEAFVRKGQMLDADGAQPLQIAVVGPTQAGKSTLVNVLLNGDVAGVSPLAGYTVQAQGFCHRVQRTECGGLQRYFGRFQCVELAELRKERHDCYALTEASGVSPLLPPCVLWDTPDFDSIDSGSYREGVLRALALADIIVLVVSKEKYADQSVWELMAMLADFKQPTLICLNKLGADMDTVLIPSLNEKWRQARSDAFPEVIPLPYQQNAGLPPWPDAQRAALFALHKKLDRRKHARLEQALLQKHWQDWLAPVRDEQQAALDWRQLVDGAIGQALAHYQRDYLDHPHHYETFQQAIAKLLVLLELPGLEGVLAEVRKLLTWPVRQLMALGNPPWQTVDTSHESAVLKQTAEHVLIQLGDSLLVNAEQHRYADWWWELCNALRERRADLLQDFTGAAKGYRLTFQQDVEKTAHHLYQRLQQQPVLLNSLRATRVTTDAAGIALSLYTGGVGIHDLLIAPAMLTVTSLLAESAIGGYMHSVEMQLKQRQLQTVKQKLFTDTLGLGLLNLPARISSARYFNISPEQLRAAEQQLTEKRHGLRLL